MWKRCKTGRQRELSPHLSVPFGARTCSFGFNIYEISSLSVSVGLGIRIRIRTQAQTPIRFFGLGFGFGFELGASAAARLLCCSAAATPAPTITYMSSRYHPSGSIFNSRVTSSGRREIRSEDHLIITEPNRTEPRRTEALRPANRSAILLYLFIYFLLCLCESCVS